MTDPIPHAMSLDQFEALCDLPATERQRRIEEAGLDAQRSALLQSMLAADGGAALRRAVDCIRHLLGPEARGLTGKSVSAVHDDWRSIRADMVPAINESAVWTRTRVSAREGATVS